MICVRYSNTIPDTARFCNTCGMEVPSEITHDARAWPSATDPRIGSTIGGKYHLYAKLGSGGMGAVALLAILGTNVHLLEVGRIPNADELYAEAINQAIISQVCAALDEAHRHNIVHRDIKVYYTKVKLR